MDLYRRFEYLPLLDLLGKLGIVSAQYRFQDLMYEQDYLQQAARDWHDTMTQRF